MLRSAVCRRQRGQNGMSHSCPRDHTLLDSPIRSLRTALSRVREESPRRVDAGARLQWRSSAGPKSPVPRPTPPLTIHTQAAPSSDGELRQIAGRLTTLLGGF